MSNNTEPDTNDSASSKAFWRRWVLPGVILLIVAVIMTIIVFSFTVPEWTGFGKRIIYKVPNTDVIPEKRLWDWLDLLIVPLVLAVGGIIFTWRSSHNERKIAKDRIMEDRAIAKDRIMEDQDIANDRIRDIALREYLDRMSDLLIKHKLDESKEDSAVRYVARARTLTVLRTLQGDGLRKGSVVQFLYEGGLIKPDGPIVSLSKADLSKAYLSENLSRANLSGANLSDAKLSDVDLSGANLSWAVLHRADLSNATLSGVDMSEADLSGADLSGATLSGGVYLPNTDLSDADLYKVNLPGAVLSHAILSKAILYDAKLGGVDLSGAVLHGADLSLAFMSLANMSWANLLGAKGVTKDQLESAASCSNLWLPDGTQCSDDGQFPESYSLTPSDAPPDS